MIKILLIGGSGLIGYYLVPLLVREGHDVTVVSRGYKPLSEKNVTHITADRSTAFEEQRLSGKYDVVIDNVAYTPEDCKSLLDTMRGRINHYIVTSTAFVYPQLERALPEPSRTEDAISRGLRTFEEPVMQEFQCPIRLSNADECL